MTKPRVGALCSGYGGLELGLLSVIDAEVVWHVENDKHPSVVLDTRFPGVSNHGDLTTLDFTTVEPVDILSAGYPCQPFSHAGKRRGSKDERHLWPYVARAIGVLRPRRVVLENVAGHVSLGLDAVLWDLAALGYDAVWGVVRAADAGAPHNRARVFIVATDTRSERHGRGEDGRSLGRVDGTDAREARQRERARPEPVDRSAAVVADSGGGPLAGAAATGDGLSITAECGAITPTHASGNGRDEGWPESARLLGRPDAAERSDDALAHTDDDAARARFEAGDPTGSASEPPQLSEVDWGVYAAAVARWEAVTGRRAPRPTEPGRTGERLSPRFVEWMMGLPDGWVTDVLSRNPALKCLGNGVVPQQAALALRLLLPLIESDVAA